MTKPITEKFNEGDFINIPLNTLVKEYILALKGGHNRTYTAISELEDISNDIVQRISTLETGVEEEIIAERSLKIGFEVQQNNHTLNNFDAVYYNGSSFVRSGNGVACQGIAIVKDINNFTLVMQGIEIMPDILTDDQGEVFVQGDFYFVSSKTAGKYQIDKPTVGLFQSVFQCVIHDSVKYALINVTDPIKLIPPIRASIQDAVGFYENGDYTWTVPNDVFKIKVTLAGSGGGGGGNHTQTDGTDSTLKLNGSNIMIAKGGKKGVTDGWSVNAPTHSESSGGSINIIGGGSCGGIGAGSETGGDNDTYCTDGSNGGLSIKYIEVTPQDTIEFTVGKGGVGGFSSASARSSSGSDGYCLIEY